LVAACTAALGLVPIDMVVSTRGRVVSMHPTNVVQPLETAIVRQINVREGQVVRAGTLLARLDPTFSEADVDALNGQVQSFQAEVDRLAAEADNTAYRPTTADAAAAVQMAIYAQRQAQYRFDIESFTQKINSLQAELSRAESDVAAYKLRRDIAAELESKRRELERKKVGSQVNRLIAEDQRIEMDRNLADATGTAERARRNLQQMTAERDSYQERWKSEIGQELTTRSRALNDAKEALRKATLRHQLVELKAEQDATVLTVAKVSVGSVLQSGDPLITLVPTNAPLEVEADLAGADAGYVREGRPVKVKFDSFPFVQYGLAHGSVRTISADSFAGERDGQRSYYKTRVSLDKVDMHDVPGGFRLKPGMPVTADIHVGRRTLLTYLFARVLPIGLEGMREP
jgi:HlyD family type I secretion membrane fusion protein